MRRSTLIIGMMLLLVAGLPVGCSRDAEPTMQHEIAVTTGVSGMQKRVSAISSNTDLQTCDLKIDAYFHNTNTKYINGVKLVYDTDLEPDSWRFDDGSGNAVHYYWPIEGSVYEPSTSNITVSSLDFVGFCPYDLANTGVTAPVYNEATGSLQMTCSLPMTNTGDGITQNNLQEFLWAYANGQTKDSNSGTVNMSFQHPFARVRFQLSASHPNIQIDSIVFKGLKSGGACTYVGGTTTWTSLTPAGTVDFVATLNQTLTTSASIQTIGTDYIVVPQMFAGDIVMKTTWDDWGAPVEHYHTAQITSVEWQPGCSYTYTFTITETDLIVDTERYTEQW